MFTKVISRASALSCLIAGIALTLAGQQPAQQSRVEPSLARLRQHVEYLASEELEGRRTGTPGADKAANYIAEEFARLGLQPFEQFLSTRVDETPAVSAQAVFTKKEAARFYQPFPYVTGVELGKENTFTFSREPSVEKVADKSNKIVSLTIGEDWMPLGVSSNSKLKNMAAVIVGYGITAADLSYNDYAGKEVAGKIAIALYGTPDGDNPHGRFARYEDVRWKAIAARNAGAKALVVISNEDKVKEDRLVQLRYDNSTGDADLPVVVISKDAALHMLSETGNEVNDLTRFVEQASSVQPVAVNLLINLATDLVRQEAAAMNVIGILPGGDANLRSEAIVIGAHYDHLGRGGVGSLAPRGGEVHHGADDNASGVAGVLELARIVTSQRQKPPRTIVFIAFSGEEEGLLGSSYYVNHPLLPLTKTVAMINLDMIGRLKNNKLIIGGVGTAQEWRNSIDKVQKSLSEPGSLIADSGKSMPVGEGFPKPFDLTLKEDGFGPSDHASFYAKRIPVLFFWTGTHEDYHKPSDTADKINYPDEARIVSLVGRIVTDVGEKRLTYAVTKGEPGGRFIGFRVYLGTIPSYGDSNNGLLLAGVREDSPAAKAGLKAGDRIVKLAGREVRNVEEYTFVLSEMKAGEEYEVEVVRGTERLKLKLTPAARK